MTENENFNNIPEQTPPPSEPTPPPVSEPTPPPVSEPTPSPVSEPTPPPSEKETYTWQNPNPYYSGDYRVYDEKKSIEPKEKKIRFTEIALIVVSSISVMLLIMVITLAMSQRNIDSEIADDSATEQSDTDNKKPSTDKNGKDDGKDDKDKDKDKNNTTIQRPTEDLPTLETQKPSTDALTIPSIYNKVKDSVVSISVQAKSQGGVASGYGTGIVLSEDGFISTNAHVVDEVDSIKVILTDGTEYEAQLIGIDTKTDLAVLKIEATGLKPAEFGDSDSLAVGETVVAIGNPYGIELAGTVTSGIVSAVNRQIVIDSYYMTLIQTDASINPGNSGGPLVNSYGQVIGITSSKIVKSGYEGIGFAIPMSGATSIIQDLIQYGYIKDRPYIGVMGYDVTESDALMYDVPQGVRVQSVEEGSDAKKQGVKANDIIVAVDGVEVKSMAELDAEKNKKKPGDKLTLTVYRNGKEKDITITLAEMPAEE